ncbi:MAG: hypothetical protein IKE43_10770 [Coriobacteriales bacterium]|nr:hypothetical protein [Coriobacteriales bacterium]
MMHKMLLTILSLSLGTILLSALSGANAEPIGTWYEQSEYGGVLEVTQTTITYTASENRFTEEAELTLVESGSDVLLTTKEEDWFFYVDMSYNSEEDTVYAHTMPHMDGDGGYNLVVFKRTPYVAPPAPVYDPAVDNSDPNAPHEFSDMTMRSMEVSFYDMGVYQDPHSDMAMPEPYKGSYSYTLSVQEDGSALASSSFCEEIILPKETVDELQKLIDESGLGQINGLDIHTPGLPQDALDYTCTMVLASGETIKSSANGDNIPESWASFQESMHHLLYLAFVNAGYHNGGTFHSTEPMLRLGTGVPPHYAFDDDWGVNIETPAQYGSANKAERLKITYDVASLTTDPVKSYDYELSASYPVVTGVDPSRPELLAALQDLCDYYKTEAARSLQEDYDLMEAVPQSVWSEATRRTCTSSYKILSYIDHGTFVSLVVQEGHSNSFGVGEHQWGYYPMWRYNIDTETGEILSAASIFVNPDEACRVIAEKLRNSYGTHRDEGVYIHSDAFPTDLRAYIEVAGPQGITWNAGYDGVELSFPQELFSMTDHTITVTLTYDELQDVLSEQYATVW